MFSPSESGCARSENQACAWNAIACEMIAPSFTITATAAPASRSPGVAPVKFSISQRCSGAFTKRWQESACSQRGLTRIRRKISSNPDHALRQRDALEGADHVVGAFLGEEAFVITGPEI